MTNVKKVMAVAIVVSLMLVLAHGIPKVDAAETSLEKFSKATEGIAEDLETLFDLVGEAIEGKELPKAKITKVLGEIGENAKVLAALGKKENAKYTWDANQTVIHVDEGVERLEVNDLGEMICAASHIAIHNHNIQLLNPQFLRDTLVEHVDELNEELNKSDVEWEGEVEEIYEHLALHSNQMGIAADIFGKKIWIKFTDQFRAVADKIREPIEEKKAAEAKTIAKDFKKPLAMIVKLVK